MIPKTLALIRDYLTDKKISLDNSYEDGRVASAVSEKNIIDAIKKNFEIIVGKKRSCYDFAYEEDNRFYPVNIKITRLSTDNLNCKLGIYYALTGQKPDFDNEIRWEKLEIIYPFKLIGLRIGRCKRGILKKLEVYLLERMKQSFELRAKPYQEFLKAFPEFTT